MAKVTTAFCDNCKKAIKPYHGIEFQGNITIHGEEGGTACLASSHEFCSIACLAKELQRVAREEMRYR